MAPKQFPDILAQSGITVLDAVLSANPALQSRDGEIEFPIARIKIGRRLRPLGSIDDLVDSIRRLGLLNAITLLPDGTLVAGRHRLAAAEALGWTHIRSRITELDAVDAELAEIDENLRRSELTVLEQAEHLLRREELLAARGQRAQPGDNQHTDGATTAAIADSMGLSERSAQQRLQIARNLTQAARDRLRGTDLAESTTRLLELSRQPQQYQAAIVEKLLANEIMSIEAAYNIVVPRPQYAEVREIENDIRAAVAAKGLTSQQLRESIRGKNRSVLLLLQQATTKQYLRPKFDQAVHNVAAQMETAARTAAAQAEAATRTAAAQTIGKPLVDWTDDDWAAYDAASRPAATPAQPEPQPAAAPAVSIDTPAEVWLNVEPPPTIADWQIILPIPAPADDRNRRIDAVVNALTAALAALGDYEDLTGNYTHSLPLRRQVNAMLDTLEVNRL